MNAQRTYRVGFWLGDASSEYGGIGPYAFRILTALLENHEPGWDFVLLCNSALPENLQRTVSQFPGVVELSLIPSPPASQQLQPEQLTEIESMGQLLPASGVSSAQPRVNYLKQWLTTLNLDLLHFPTQTILHRDLQVPYAVTMYGAEELPHVEPGIPFIVTMHDVQELHLPENFTPLQRAIRAVQYWKTMEKAGKVVVSYNHVKADLIKFFGLPPDKTHVCPIPFRAISLREPTATAAGFYNEKYDSLKPFLLYPSHTWRHKNHALLLESLKEIHRRYDRELRLICTGGTNHHYHQEVMARVEALGLRDSVLFAGIVPEDELCWLYKQTALVTIPTKYEAGSFPLYEAMLLGAPVICSNVTSLPETIGDQRFVFDPDDVEELSSLIIRLLSEAHFRQDNIANSMLQADRLRQVNAAAYFYRTYRSLVQQLSSS